MTNPDAAHPPVTAMELIAEEIGRVRSTDPTDTAAALLAAWHGFGAGEAAGALLAQDNPDDGVLARNARPVFAAVAQRLRAAPSLPYTDQVSETIVGLTPASERPKDSTERREDPDMVPSPSPADNVRHAILDLALELNTLLPAAAEHARDPADRRACQHGARLAYELSSCWEGRLRSFLNKSRTDL